MSFPFRKPSPADPVKLSPRDIKMLQAAFDRIKLDIGDALAYLADGRTAKAKEKLLALQRRFG